MSYQQAIFANGEVYHLFNRGVEKRTIFSDRRDHQRFIQTLSYYSLKNPPTRFSFKNRVSKLKSDQTKLVQIIGYCLMPNHFHLLLQQLDDGGITSFLSKTANSYTKYFNTKYDRVGPLFQGVTKAVRITSEEQLNHVSRYIHLNPLVDFMVKDLRDYPYSSYQQFLGLARGICSPEIVLSNFSSIQDYEQFVLDQVDYARTIKTLERQLLEEVSDRVHLEGV